MSGNHILVVDDSQVISSLLDDFLSEKGFRVSLAGTAEEAFVKIKEKLPDLIVLDLVLPDVHGLQFCRVLKSDPKTRHIPIIMATAKAIEVKDKVEGLKAGADDYITKPFELSEFFERVNAILRRVEMDREKTMEAEAAGTVEKGAMEEAPEIEWPSLKGWQKFLGLMIEPGWLFSWIFKGPSKTKEWSMSFLVVLFIPVVSELEKLFSAGARLGAEALSGLVKTTAFVLAWLVLSGIFELFFSLAGKKSQFRSMGSVVGLSLTPLLWARILELIYVLSGGRPGEFSSDLSLVFVHVSKGMTGFLLRRADLFEIWSLVLGGIGLSCLFDISRKKSFGIVSCLWLIGVGFGIFLVRLPIFQH